MNRVKIIDQIRGFAVVLMIIFHFSYDLNLFGHTKIDFSEGFWYWFPRLIVFLFLYCVGYSLCLANSQKDINWPVFWKRIGKLSLFALIISLSTYFMFPKNWVYFGTLHCIAVASILGILLVNRPRTSLALAIIIPTSALAFGITYKKLSSIVPINSMDFIPIYPWFFVVCIGIAQYHFAPWKRGAQLSSLQKFLKYLGKHSLLIYVLHQPIIFGVFYLHFLLTK